MTADHRLKRKNSGGSVTTIEAEAIADILDLPTAETDDSLVLAPDGVGGIEFRAQAGGTITVEDEGSPLSTAADTLDFVGDGVTASGTGTTKTITIPGAGVTEILDLPTAEDDDSLVLAPDGDGGVEFRAETGGGLADEGAFTYLDATDGSAPANPSSGYARIYAKSGRVYSRDSGGVEYGPFDAAGGGAGTPICLLQEIQAGSTNAADRSADFVVAPRDGSHIIVFASCEVGHNVTAVTLTNATFVKLAESTASTAPHCEIWLGTVGASAGVHLYVSWSGANYVNFLANEWTGLTGTLDQSAVVTNSASHDIPVITATSAAALVISGGANSTYNGDNSYYSGTSLNHCIEGHAGANFRCDAAFGFPGMVAIDGSFPNTHGGTFSGVSLSIT